MSQLGYGNSDPVGSPFNFFSGANVVTGTTFTMTSARLVLAAGATVAAYTVNLPLNPPDGCIAEISSTNTITAFSVAANTGDTIVNGVLGALTTLVPAASTSAGGATATVRFAYSLNGSQAGNAAVLGARTWTRIS